MVRDHPRLALLAPLTQALRHGAGPYLVGGAVRDLAEGKEPGDLDLATSLLPEEVQRALEGGGFRVIPTGVEHGTLLVLLEEGSEGVEVTTFRSPSNRDATRFGTSIEEDLSGRDFTINAIAVDLTSGDVIDPFGGLAAIERGMLAAVGDPVARMEEDPIRILRAVRFGVAEGRRIEESLGRALVASVTLLGSVAVERIGAELDKILQRPCAGEALRSMREIGLLPWVLPEALPSVGALQNEFHTEDVFDHTATVVGRSAPDRFVRWAALFHDLGKPATTSLGEDGRRHFYCHEEVSARLVVEAGERLRLGNDWIERVALLVRLHMRPLDCGPVGARRILRDCGDEYDRWRLLKIADAPPLVPEPEFMDQLARFDALIADERRKAASRSSILALNGNDLIAIGIPAGPEIGAILRYLNEQVIEDPDRNTRESLLALVAEFHSTNKSS